MGHPTATYLCSSVEPKSYIIFFRPQKGGLPTESEPPFVVVITINKILIVFDFVKGYMYVSHL